MLVSKYIFQTLSLAISICAVAGSSAHAQTFDPVANEALKAEVMRTETEFADTLARHDLKGFSGFLSEDAYFFGFGGLRGPEAIVKAWAAFFEPPVAEFSWRPDRVEVLASGNLALSTGLVYDADGKPISVFNSIWRQEAPEGQPHRWRIIFDKGSAYVPGRKQD